MLRTLLAAVIMLGATSAHADPIIEPGGEPGAAVSWTKQANGVTLMIAADYDPEDIRQAIMEAWPKARTKMDGERVIVMNVPPAKLLASLEKIDVIPMGDDIEAMLSNIRTPGESQDGSGSSIRATQQVDFGNVGPHADPLIYGRVVDIEHHKFPLVILTVKVTRSPKAGPAGLKNGKTIRIIPRVKSKRGVIDPKDEASKLNAGAWYVQRGDRIRARLASKPKKTVWVAHAFERVR